MALLPEIIDAMVATGCTAEQISAVVKAHSEHQEAAERARQSEERARRVEKAAKNAERQRRHRERNAMSRDVTDDDRYSDDVPVTPHPPCSPRPSPAPQPTPLNPPAPNTRAVGEAVARFWQAYPRRDGSNPRKTALEKFEAAVKGGADPEAIIAAAEAYRRECDRLGFTRTPKVAQCQTWFNQRRWEDYAIPDPPESEADWPAAKAMLSDETAEVGPLLQIRDAEGWEAAERYAQQNHRRTA